MNIAIITPKAHSLSHRVRGSGFYIKSLSKSLLKYDKDNSYIFVSEGESIPKSIDLIHYSYFEPFFLTLPFFKNKKSAVTVHDLIPLVFPDFFPKGIRGSIKWEMQKRLIQNMDRIITDSNSSKNDIVKFLGVKKDRIRVIYLATSEEFKKLNLKNSEVEKIKKKYDLPPKFALYVGDVTWNKNLPRLLSATRKINITLVMVGSALANTKFDKSNPWNQDLVRVHEMSEEDKRIMKLGFVDKEDLVSLYNLATVFVMPSLYEGFGLPVLEAMSCGCPVVTSKEGSLKEVGEDAVYYVNPYDVNDIANGIGEVYFNPGLAKNFSDKGLAQAKKFNLKKFALETAKTYQSI